MLFIYIILALLAAVVLYLWTTYNSLVRKRLQADEAWSDIDTQLKRRYDLIPNLVEAVKGYVKHERETLESVTRARTAAMTVHDAPGHHLDEQLKSENMLTGALKSLFAVAEQYPDLKANQNFIQLQDELADTENKVQAARRFYNGNVRDYNTALAVFPNNLVADMFKFTAREFFEIPEERQEEREAVKVKF